jgi:pimeloyl-ACP methyl ester carboxylesterase
MNDLPSFTEQSMTLVDGPLSFMEAGTGEPVLLLHGIFGHKGHWQALGDLLTPSYRVIAPDLPLHGRSRSFGPEYGPPDTMARAVYQLTAELGLDRFHVAGNSFGGGVAGVLAALYPKNVASLAFLGAPPVRTPIPSELDQARAKGVTPIVPKTMEEFDHKISLLFYGAPNISPDKLKEVGTDEIARWPENTELWKRAFGDFYFFEAFIDRIVAPTLCIWGQEDRITDISGAAPLSARLKDCKLVVVPRTGHAVMQEDFQNIADLYLTFLRDHPLA